MKISRMFAVKALLLGAIALPTLTVPAFGQQEVDPTWHDPWAIAGQSTAQPAAAKAHPENLRKTNTAAAEQPRSKKQVRAQAPRDTDQQPAMMARK